MEWAAPCPCCLLRKLVESHAVDDDCREEMWGRSCWDQQKAGEEAVKRTTYDLQRLHNMISIKSHAMDKDGKGET